MGFFELGIRAEVCEGLLLRGIAEPTPIQERTIPVVLGGHDIIAQAHTGTGKTLAFLLPIFERIDPSQPSVQALVLTPTRELAIQIATEAQAIMDGIGVLALYGGQDINRQINQLKGSIQLMIATPGRLLDHVRRTTLQLSTISVLVLDEADQMLQLGFLPDVEAIMQATPDSRQTLLFSATMPPLMKSLCRRYLRAPKDIRVESRRVAVETVRQLVVETTDRTKQDALRRYLDEFRPYLAIIFCRTKRRAKTLCEALQARGYRAEELHGDVSQAGREQVIHKFRSAQIRFLVATDVAARGLDVEGVTHVFNYDIPHDVESYIHRIGRTGRAGGKGVAVTFVAPKDAPFLRLIEKGIRQSLKKLVVTGTRALVVDSAGGQKTPHSKPETVGRARRAKNRGTNRKASRFTR